MTIYEARIIIGLPNNYNEAILKQQYRKMAKKYHPDNYKLNGVSEAEANKKFKELQEAYNLLEKELEMNAFNSFYHQTGNEDETIKLKEKMEVELKKEFDSSKKFYMNIANKITKIKNGDLLLQQYQRYQNFLRKEIASLRADNWNYEKLIEFQKKTNLKRKTLLNEMNTSFKEITHQFIVFSLNNQALWNEFQKGYQYEETIYISNWGIYFLVNFDKLFTALLKLKLEEDEKEVDNILSNYANYAYYEMVKNKLEKLKQDTITKLQNCNSYEMHKTIIDELSTKANQIFVDYENFLNMRQSRIDNVEQYLNAFMELYTVSMMELFYFNEALANLRKERDEEAFSKIESAIYSKAKKISASRRHNKISTIHKKSKFSPDIIIDSNYKPHIYPKNKPKTLKKKKNYDD